MQYVLVAINLPVRNLFKQFLYRAPADRPDLAAGWRVLVPFGRNEVEGFVVRTYTEDEARHRMEADGAKMGLEDIREVLAVLGEEPWFDAEMLATAHWLARYYMCTDAEAMRLFIPGKSSLRRRTVYQDGKAVARTWEERLKPRTVLSYRLTEAGRQALSDGQVPERSRNQRDGRGGGCSRHQCRSTAHPGPQRLGGKGVPAGPAQQLRPAGGTQGDPGPDGGTERCRDAPEGRAAR